MDGIVSKYVFHYSKNYFFCQRCRFFLMLNNLELSDFEFNVATQITSDMFRDWKRGALMVRNRTELLHGKIDCNAYCIAYLFQRYWRNIYTEVYDTIMVYNYNYFFVHFDKLSRISWFQDKMLQFRIVKIAFFFFSFIYRLWVKLLLFDSFSWFVCVSVCVCFYIKERFINSIFV